MKTHKAKNTAEKSKRIRSIVLSVVAVAELLLLLLSMTFSWFEELTSLEMSGQNIRTANNLNSHVVLGENKNSGEDTAAFSNVIHLSDFYDTQREVRLSPVSSPDAQNFYAAYAGTPGKDGTKYRLLRPEDINANIIQFQFNLSCDDGPTDVYLSEIYPKIFINDKEDTAKSKAFRIAFSDGKNTRIICPSTTLNSSNYATLSYITSLNTDNTAKTGNGAVENYLDYYYSSTHEYNKSLFSLEKGETKTITCSLWLEAFDSASSDVKPGDSVSFDIRMCTSWSISREITVYDYTANQWILIKDESDIDTTLYVRNMDGDYGTKKDEYNKDVQYDNRRLYELEYQNDHTWTCRIPIALKNCEFIWRQTKGENTTYNRWYATDRGDNTVLSILGAEAYNDKRTEQNPSRACIWGMDSDDITKISFKDYTSDAWINNKGSSGEIRNMTVEVIADDRVIEYSMTSSGDDVAIENGKNTWYCFIPSDVDDVKFKRSGNNNGTYSTLNYWIGNNRITEEETHTVYRATDENAVGSSIGTDKFYVLYFSVPSDFADRFFNGKQEPTISYTNASNINAGAYNPSKDTWPTSGRPLEKVSGKNNLYYIAFPERPTGNTTITVWNRSNINKETKVPDDVGFSTIQINWSAANTISVAEMENYNFALGTSTTSNPAVGTISGTNQSGMWGDLDLSGFRTYFVPLVSTNSVTATFTYKNETHTVNMTKGDDGIWYTDSIPSSIKYVTFKDSNNYEYGGSTQSAYSPRTEEHPYFYVTKAAKNGVGTFFSQYPPEGNKVNFRHYDDSISKVTASFEYTVKYEGTNYNIPFKFDLEKGSDDLTWSTNKIPSNVTDITFSDGTNTWHTTSGRDVNAESTYCAHNNKRLYFTPDSWATNNAWFAAYFWNSSGNTWRKLTDDNSDGIYEVTIPDGYTDVIFCKMNSGNDSMDWNNKSLQTNDLQIPSDNKNMYSINSATWTSFTKGYWAKPVYLVPDIWNIDNAFFVAHTWEDTNAGTVDVKFEPVPNSDFEYIAYIPKATTELVFGRIKSGASVNSINWNSSNNGGDIWNQTSDETIPSDSNRFTITNWEDGTWHQKIYLQPNNDWKTDSAWFAAYFFNETTGTHQWVKLAQSSVSGYYEGIVPGGYPEVIFCRMKSSDTATLDFSNAWNQTVDLTLLSHSDTFTITQWDNGTWNKALYFKPNDNWKKDGAWFAAKFSNTSGESKWVRLTDNNKDGIYEMATPGIYKNVTFYRMDSNKSELSSNSKWNQTGNLTIPSDQKNMFALAASAAWNDATTSWTTK